MNKRSHTAAFDEGPRLRIKLASTAEQGAPAASPLEPEAYLARMYSAVARRLPEAEEWDLSGLLVDGQPVRRDTAVAWLNAAYQNTYDRDCEQQQDSPACSAEGLYRLLAFADAVDSTGPLLRACCSGLQDLQLHAQLAEQQVSLKTDGTAYAFSSDGGLMAQLDSVETFVLLPGTPAAASAQQQAAFSQQVAAQTEQLLWLAYRLQLEPLMQHLHGFIRPCHWFLNSLLGNAPDAAVFTPRVLEAAGVASLPGGKQMLMNSVLGETAEVSETSDSSVGTWLKPVGLTAGQREPLRFDAVVLRSGLRIAQGSTVPVELDLFGQPKITLGKQAYNVQLRIGRLIGADT